MSKRLRVAVLFGGRSGEHDVSLQSAASVIKALDPAKYDILPVGITREGNWRVGSGAAQLLPQVLEIGDPVTPSVDPSGPKLLPLARSLSGSHSRPEVDVVFPVLHGTFGEDGTVQGLFELADIPYVGAGVLASATGMDKDVMKRLFRDGGLPVLPWELLLRAEWERDPDQVRRRIEKEVTLSAVYKAREYGIFRGDQQGSSPARTGGRTRFGCPVRSEDSD